MGRGRSWRGARLFLVGLFALWTVEVVGHLGLPRRLLAGDGLLVSPTGFLALAVADAHIVLPAAVIAVVITASDRAATCVLSAILTGATAYFLATGVWTVPGWTAWPLATLIAVLAGAAYGRWLPRDARRLESPEHALFWTVCPALALAVLGTGLSHVLASAPRAAALHGLLGLVLLLLGRAITVTRGRPLTLALGCAPTLAAILLAAYASVSPAIAPAPLEKAPRDVEPGRRDIVMVVLDTVRADHLRAYGYPRDTMPGLELWARDMLVARRAIAPAGWTTPSHASMFSGLNVSRHGVHYASTDADGAWLRTRAVDDIAWLPAVLSEEGYVCLAVSANEFAVPKEMRGFHRVITPTPAGWSGRTLGGRLDQSVGLLLDLGERLRWRMPYVEAGDLVEQAIRATPSDRGPVFLFVNVMDAHSPYNPPRAALARLGVSPPRLFDRYTTHRALTSAWNALPEGSATVVEDLYDGELVWLDMQLERFWQWIDQRFPDALVVVTSDHGEELGEQGRVGHEYGLSQRLLHVPLWIRHPELPTGEVERPTSLVNLYRLIRQVGRGSPPEVGILTDVGGEALIAERYPSRVNRDTLGPEYSRFWVAAIQGTTKIIGPSAYGVEAYDLGGAGFDNEIALVDATRTEPLRELVDRYFEQFRDRRNEVRTDEGTSHEIERLRSLGYVD